MYRSTNVAIATAHVPSFEGGEGDEVVIDANNPAVQALINKAVEDATAPLKANRDDILDEKRGMKEKLESLQQQWSGFDPVAVRSLLDKFQNDEEAKLIAEGKFDEVMAKRTDALRTDFTTQIEARDKRIAELEGGLTSRDGKITTLVIDRSVQEAAAQAECLGSAVPDIILRARTVFSLGEDDAPIAKDASGATLYGKDGKAPITPAEWLDGQREASAHWWAPSSGGGAGGGTGNQKPGADGIENMSPREKLVGGMFPGRSN